MRRASPLVVLASLGILVLCGGENGASAAGASAGAPHTSLHAGDVIVATVRKVSDHAATRGNPPRVVLEVHEVLRGDPKVDRSRAIWDPPLHDIDTGDVEKNPRFKAWAATPMAGPKVGDKMILWGWLARAPEGKAFRAVSWGRFPYSKEKRAWAVKLIKKHAEQKRAREAKARAEKKALAEAKAQWRLKVSAEDIQRYITEADFVGIGRIVSGHAGSTRETRIGLEISEILKGTKRKHYPNDRYFVHIVVPGPVCALLDRRTSYLVFLSENGMELNPAAPTYPRIRSGDGIAIADRAAVKAAKDSIEKAPKVAPRPLMVLSVSGRLSGLGNYHRYRRQIAAYFERAAGEQWTVARANLFTHGIGAETTARLTRKLVPGAAALVVVSFHKRDGGAGPPTRLSVAAVRLARDRNRILFKQEWSPATEKEVLEKAAEAVKKLAASEHTDKRGPGK